MGKKLVIELTNRCNLACHHCFSGRHGGRTDLPLSVLEQVLGAAKLYGFTEVSFTGGEPTLYPAFADALQLTCDAGYQVGLNTNGWNFVHFYPLLVRHRPTIITFSLDGATAATHDRLRGHGSFRRLMQALSLCVVKALPFSLNMVITAQNCHEVGALVALAPKLGSRGIRFGHLLSTPMTVAQGADLSFAERRVVEAEVAELARQSALPVVMAPGYYTTALFPCAPLQYQEININCFGELTKCCHLSGHGSGVAQADVIGALTAMSFAEAYARLNEENTLYRQRKVQHLQAANRHEEDYWPCWYCSRYYGKTAWLQAKGTVSRAVNEHQIHASF